MEVLLGVFGSLIVGLVSAMWADLRTEIRGTRTKLDAHVENFSIHNVGKGEAHAG